MAVRLSSGDGWWNVRSVCQHQIVGAAMVVGVYIDGVRIKLGSNSIRNLRDSSTIEARLLHCLPDSPLT